MFGWYKWKKWKEKKKQQQEEEIQRLHIESIKRTRALGDEIRRRREIEEHVKEAKELFGERMKFMTTNGTNLENTADDYKNLNDELMKVNKVETYKYISRERPELGLGVIYTEQNELIGLVEHEMDLDELESFEREDVEQFYNLDKFFEIPDSIMNMSDFFKWALGEKK